MGIEDLKAHPAIQGTTIGVVGFSLGGHWALWLSQYAGLPIGATVTLHGVRGGDYTSSQFAILGHFAELDDWVSDAALKKLKKSIEYRNNKGVDQIKSADCLYYIPILLDGE